MICKNILYNICWIDLKNWFENYGFNAITCSRKYYNLVDTNWKVQKHESKRINEFFVILATLMSFFINEILIF